MSKEAPAEAPEEKIEYEVPVEQIRRFTRQAAANLADTEIPEGRAFEAYAQQYRDLLRTLEIPPTLTYLTTVQLEGVARNIERQLMGPRDKSTGFRRPKYKIIVKKRTPKGTMRLDRLSTIANLLAFAQYTGQILRPELWDPLAITAYPGIGAAQLRRIYANQNLNFLENIADRLAQAGHRTIVVRGRRREAARELANEVAEYVESKTGTGICNGDGSQLQFHGFGLKEQLNKNLAIAENLLTKATKSGNKKLIKFIKQKYRHYLDL